MRTINQPSGDFFIRLEPLTARWAQKVKFHNPFASRLSQI
jgi:hypothetical protein